ncbi:Bud-site selection protein [Cyathus striatus]|nr:Bud-site selection protein [Cyathus striatus]
MKAQDSQVGHKRKRYIAPSEDIGTKITKKLHHHLKEVRKAAKKAKDFETRKLVKKLNELRRKEDALETIEDHESQLKALKEIGHDEIGNMAMRTKCMKDHILSTSERLTAALAEEVSAKLVTLAPPGTLVSKLQSRLLSSKVLAQEVSTCVDSLRNLIQSPTTIKEDPMKTRNKIKDDTMDIDAVADNDAEMEDLEDDEDDGEPVDETGWESGTIGDDENEADDGWESGSLDGEHLTSADEEDETGSLGLNSDDERPQIKVAAMTSRASKASSSATQSTFLPSLAVGFIRGSDDSDFSEGEAKIADNTVKKNRRGQRARQAIWEKKYGRNANHKKKEFAEKSAVAKEKAERRRGKADRFPNSTGGPEVKGPISRLWLEGALQGSQNPAPSAANFKRADDKPLHPSWEAKRKLKEKDFGGIVPSQGQKIKFS